MSVYDLFYEGPDGEIWNCHGVATDPDWAATEAARVIRGGSPSVTIELRRSQEEIDAMLERRKARSAALAASSGGREEQRT